jgi:hypothetical protein
LPSVIICDDVAKDPSDCLSLLTSAKSYISESRYLARYFPANIPWPMTVSCPESPPKQLIDTLPRQNYAHFFCTQNATKTTIPSECEGMCKTLGWFGEITWVYRILKCQKRVQTTGLCLSGQHVGEMLPDMLADMSSKTVEVGTDIVKPTCRC